MLNASIILNFYVLAKMEALGNNKRATSTRLLQRIRSFWNYLIETVSPEGTFCDTVEVPFGAGDMQLI